jgi:hypothetical protein
MIARLGNVLYWAGCVLAALIAGFGAIAAFQETWNPWGSFIVCAMVAAVVWIIGRICRYVLAGR